MKVAMDATHHRFCPAGSETSGCSNNSLTQSKQRGRTFGFLLAFPMALLGNGVEGHLQPLLCLARPFRDILRPSDLRREGRIGFALCQYRMHLAEPAADHRDDRLAISQQISFLILTSLRRAGTI